MTPRLLTERAAADYLSLKPRDMAQVAVGRVSVAGRLRFDRVALDRWLDGGVDVSGPAAPSAANANVSPASAALARFVESHPDVAGRAPR